VIDNDFEFLFLQRVARAFGVAAAVQAAVRVSVDS
jgi:hypothetical protein